MLPNCLLGRWRPVRASAARSPAWGSPGGFLHFIKGGILRQFFDVTFVVTCVFLWKFCCLAYFSVRIFMGAVVYFCFHFEFAFPGGLVQGVPAAFQRSS